MTTAGSGLSSDDRTVFRRLSPGAGGCDDVATTGPATVADLSSPTMHEVQPARVFVGLKLAPEIARQLAELAQPLEGYGVRPVPNADMHLTLVAPWNEPDVANAAERVRTAVDGFGDFSLTFVRLQYGPTLRHPRLLWAECVASNALAELRTALLTAFGQSDPRPFRPHVTVVRLRTGGRTLARKIPINQQLSLTQSVTSVELFQSPLKHQSGYQVLASLALRAQPHLESMRLAQTDAAPNGGTRDDTEPAFRQDGGRCRPRRD